MASPTKRNSYTRAWASGSRSMISSTPAPRGRRDPWAVPDTTTRRCRWCAATSTPSNPSTSWPDRRDPAWERPPPARHGRRSPRRRAARRIAEAVAARTYERSELLVDVCSAWRLSTPTSQTTPVNRLAAGRSLTGAGRRVPLSPVPSLSRAEGVGVSYVPSSGGRNEPIRRERLGAPLRPGWAADRRRDQRAQHPQHIDISRQLIVRGVAVLAWDQYLRRGHQVSS